MNNINELLDTYEEVKEFYIDYLNYESYEVLETFKNRTPRPSQMKPQDEHFIYRIRIIFNKFNHFDEYYLNYESNEWNLN